MKVVWTAEALVHLKQIRDYIATDSQYWAAREIEKILAHERTIGEFPKLGRIVPEYEDEMIREVFEDDYRIVYRIVSDAQIDVLGVIHGARKLTRE